MATDPRPVGRIITFYSYKGGTGRTMALANVAWILASAGKRVLVADWDLEAPGLPRFFKPFLPDQVGDTHGVIDLIRSYEDEVTKRRPRPEEWVQKLASLEEYVRPISWDFPRAGRLDLLTAGRQNIAYATSLSALDWDNFYGRLRGGHFLDAVREYMRSNYDYVLIDSRTGFSDVADICTQHLPDTLVDCYTLSDQGIDGAARVAKAVATYGRENDQGRSIRVLPVAMRVDQAEKDRADAGRARAMYSFVGLPEGMSEPERNSYYNAVEVPYQPFYAYEEILATFDRPGMPGSLLAAYERLTRVLSDGEVSEMAPMDKSVRVTWQRRFERPQRPDFPKIVLEYAAEDQVWAEWVESVLSHIGVTVVEEGPTELPGVRDPGSEQEREILSIVSVLRSEAVLADKLVLLVADVRLREPKSRAAASIDGLTEVEAAQRLLGLLRRNVPSLTEQDLAQIARFPGAEPTWLQSPPRNAMFTGRTADLRHLRRMLKAQERAVILPVALHGMGGIGKSQLALEYVHRFRSAYDLIWWVDADPPQFIDAALADLGERLDLGEVPTATAMAEATLEALRLGTRTRRWLLVFDNAGEPADVARFLPQSRGGHVLITSRNPDWDKQAKPVEVDVFRRDESIAHLRSRAGVLTTDEADLVGKALGDLPIAVAAAGAWLADTGTRVGDYLRQVERSDGDGSVREAWDATWNLSLDRLREQSPAAHRLLELCAVIGPEIALDLIYSDQMASSLTSYDQSVSERMMRGALVQQVNKLALLKLDPQRKQVQIHRLIQAAVRKRMSDQQLAATGHETHLVLARLRPSGEPDDPESWPRFRMIWPHLEVSGALECGDDSVRQLLIDRVRYLRRRGDLESGLAFGESVAEAWERLIAVNGQQASGSLYRQLLHLRFNLANILRDQARYQEALAMDDDVEAAQRTLLGARNPYTLMTSGGRAADLRALGAYEDALEQDERTFAAWREDYGDDHPRTLMAAHNLATSLRAVGDFRRARTIDEDVAERRRLVLGPSHPYSLHSRSSVGRDLREAGEYAASIQLLRQVVDLARRELGPDAIDTLNAQANLAVSLRSAGDVDEAGRLLEAAYTTLRGLFGEDNPSTMMCRLSRAANLVAAGSEQQAVVAEMSAVTRAYEDSLGPDNPFTLVCVSNQSAAHRAAFELEAATRLAVRAVQGCERQLGREHPYYLAAALNLLTCQFETGRPDGLVDRLRDLSAGTEHLLGESHPDTLGCRGNLALIGAQLEPKAAGLHQDNFSAVLETLASRLGERHPSVTLLRAGTLLYRVIDPHEPY